MPYRDPDLQRDYQRRWIARNRAEFLAGRACVRCGSCEELEVDHVDPASKTHHSIWSWSKERREVELAKCQVLCRSCHIGKTRVEFRGEAGPSAKLTEEQAVKIRELLSEGRTQSSIAEEFGIGQQAVSKIKLGQRWSHLVA